MTVRVEQMTYDELVHTTAITALVLGRDDLNVRFIKVNYNQYTLPSVLDGLLADLQDAVLEQGVEVPVLVNAEWLCLLMQVEFGGNIEVVTHDPSPVGTFGQVQFLEAK